MCLRAVKKQLLQQCQKSHSQSQKKAKRNLSGLRKKQMARQKQYCRCNEPQPLGPHKIEIFFLQFAAAVPKIDV